MPKLITVTEFSRGFSDIIGRVHYTGEVFDIQKGTRIVARLSPVKAKKTITLRELGTFFKNSPHLSKDEIEDFEQAIVKLKSLKDSGGFDKWD